MTRGEIYRRPATAGETGAIAGSTPRFNVT